MMRTAKIKLDKNRVLLSDVLPYELPIIFSNRHFLRFIKEYNFQIVQNMLCWRGDTSDAFDSFIKLLLGVNGKIIRQGDNKCITLGKNFVKIPFQYKILHKVDSFRKLTVIHPFNQLQIIAFYEQYKELMLYYCGQSTFSIRFPHCIARYMFYKDTLHQSKLSNEELGIEQYDEEYEQLKSFFVYEKYSNIHKFYDDFLFNRCEKKYNHLIKLDISRCFDSIYTHSITWALYGKDYTKSNNFAKTSFGAEFDKLMQNLNYQETHGIVIGPEFSRIFAEIILQRIDVELKNNLIKNGIYEKQHYEMFRYVDDFFVFFNDDNEKNIIFSELQQILSKYNLYLNESKKEEYNKPIITNISVAKNKIRKLLEASFLYEISEQTVSGRLVKQGKISINAKKIITDFKVIIKETNVDYKDVLNYTLAITETKLRELIDVFLVPCKDADTDRRMFLALENIIEVLVFIYSMSPRVNTSIRLARILKMIVGFYRRKGSNKNYKIAIFEQIYNELTIVLKKNRPGEYFQIETSYLLLLLQDLGKSFDFSEGDLASYFRIDKPDEGEFKQNYQLNYLSLMVLLFYTNGKKKYSNLINFVINEIRCRLLNQKCSFADAENVFLFLDTLACPYVSDDVKREILTHNNINGKVTQDEILNMFTCWFVDWRGFNLKKELDYKRGQEVY